MISNDEKLIIFIVLIIAVLIVFSIPSYWEFVGNSSSIFDLGFTARGIGQP